MEEKLKKVPKLRFKDENGEDFPAWERSRICELGSFTKGAALSKKDISSSGNPLILYGELYTTYSEVVFCVKRTTNQQAKPEQYSRIGDVIIPVSGESAEEISIAACIMIPNVILAGDLIIFRSSFIDGRITSYILNYIVNYKIARIAQGKSVVHINAHELGKITISYPTLPEQTRIADFFTKLDSYIEQQELEVEKLKEQKKGFMQKIFSQEIRFKDENGEDFPAWEEKKLGEVLIPGEKKKVENTDDYKKITVKLHLKGVGYADIKRDMKDTRPFYIRRKNELIVGKQNYFNGSVALVGEEFDGCICSNAIMSFSVKPEIIPKYILAVVSQTDFINRRAYLANGTGQKELSETDFLNFTVQIATKEEQTRIADFFTKLDEQIEVEKAILEKWKLLKKGFLQQMFI